MKHQVPPHSVACLILCLTVTLPAQNPHGNPSLLKRIFNSGATQVEIPAPGSSQDPPVEKVRGEVSDSPPLLTVKDMRALKVRVPKIRSAISSDNLDVPRKPSSYRKSDTQPRGQRYEVAANSLQEGLSMVSEMYRAMSASSRKTPIAGPTP